MDFKRGSMEANKQGSSSNKNSATNPATKKNQAGYGVIIVIMLLFFFFALVIGGMSAAFRADRSLENLAAKQREKWEAKSGLNTLRRIVEVRLPETYRADLELAKTCPGYRPDTALPSFDEQELAPEDSVPVVVVFENGRSVCNESGRVNAARQFTSLLGNSNLWATNHRPVWIMAAEQYGFPSSMVGIAQIRETVRRFSAANEPSYVFGFIVDARGGLYYRVREEGQTEVGAVFSNCGATGQLDIAPRTVTRGSEVTFQINYTAVNRLKIYSQNSGQAIHDTEVPFSFDLQRYEWRYTPSETDSYRVEALTNDAGCYSRSEWIEVVVTNEAPLCPIIDSLTANPATVNSGEVSTISWSVRQAAEVTLEDEVVSAAGSRDFTILATRTFTLRARDAAAGCPAVRQVTVTVNPPPECLTPQIAQFQVSPATANPGEQVTITWQVNNLMSGGTVNITLPDGTSLSGLGASGSRTLTAPSTSGNYTYSISASNPCGTSASANTQLTVVNSCVPPTINSFTANPSTVYFGGNQNIVFNWNVAGQIDSQSINQGIGAVSGNSHSIVQPQQTTTYTYSVVGCSETRQAQVTVNVVFSTNGCQRNQRYDLPVYTFPTEQFLIMDSNITVSYTGVVNGTVGVQQLQSEVVEFMSMEVSLYDSLNRVVFSRLEEGRNGTIPSEIVLTNVLPLTPIPTNPTIYTLRFRWYGVNNSSLEQQITDSWTITPSGCS